MTYIDHICLRAYVGEYGGPGLALMHTTLDSFLAMAMLIFSFWTSVNEQVYLSIVGQDGSIKIEHFALLTRTSVTLHLHLHWIVSLPAISNAMFYFVLLPVFNATD